MKNSKVIEILKTFSKEEIREFDKFISSPYFGCRKFIVDFFRIIKKYHPGFRDDDIEKKKLFHEMYKDKKFNDGLMRRMNSEILKYSEEYLMIKRLYKTKVYRNNCLLMELRDRNLHKLFTQKAKGVLSDLERSKEIDFYYLLDKHLTEIELHNDLVQHNSKNTFEQLEKALRSLILFFLNSYFSLSFNHKRQGKSHSDELIIKFIESLDNNNFINGIENENSEAAELIKTIYYSNRVSIESDVGIYMKMKNIFRKNYDIFTPQQKMIFYVRLFTFYQKYNLINDDRFLKEQFRDYKKVLEEKLFLIFYPYMGILFGRSYINVCRLSSGYDHIQKFVSNYSSYFDPEYKEEFAHFCYANYFLGKKKFGKSLEHSSKVRIELPVFKLDLKVLKIMCFYELKYVESFFSEIDTLNHFLRSADVVNKELLASVKKFSSYVNRLMNLKEVYSKNKLHILKSEIENEKIVQEKKWLVKKLDELLKEQNR